MHRCSQALRAGLLLCIAGLMGENLLTAAGAENSTATDLTLNSTTGASDNNFIVAISTSSVKDTSANARIEIVPTSGATVTPQSGLPTSQHELSSSTFITPSSSASTRSNDEVSSTAGPKNTSTEFTSQMSQAPHTINSTGSPTSNSTAVTSKPTNDTATHIQNSQSPSSPESFSTKTGITQTTGATTVKSTSNSINNSIEVSHPTVAVSPTVLTTMHGNVVSTVSQGSTVATAQTVAAENTKNTSPNTATAAVNEASTALSSGSIAAITVTVIFFVLVIFGGAAYLKIRHSSYGRLVDDHDYGSWGNYNNPLYDDS